MTSTDSEPDVDDVPDLELTDIRVEPDVSTPTPGSESEGTSMPVAARCSTREIRGSHRLIARICILLLYLVVIDYV